VVAIFLKLSALNINLKKGGALNNKNHFKSEDTFDAKALLPE